MYQTLLLEISGNVATITLNRPEKRNAISTPMMAELQTALDEIEKSHARVGILTGAGKAFCAGMDLDMLAAIAKQSPAENQEDSRRIAKLFRRIWSFPRPLIAAVNGAAYAGGCGIATLCDFTLAVPEAKFGYTEVKIGFLPAIVSVFLTRQIGEKRCRDLLLTGSLRRRQAWITIWNAPSWRMRAFAARRISRRDWLRFWRSASRSGGERNSDWFSVFSFQFLVVSS